MCSLEADQLGPLFSLSERRGGIYMEGKWQPKAPLRLVPAFSPYWGGLSLERSLSRTVLWSYTLPFCNWVEPDLDAQHCRAGHAHTTEIGRDTNKASRAFSDHPVIQYKNHRGNNSALPKLSMENSQAPTLNEHTLAQAQVSSTEIG